METDGGEQQALERILARAATDSEFRRRLLTEPKEAIRDAFGVVIPSNFRIKFIERDPDVDALVVLPDPKAVDGALSDNDLEWVSGGVDGSDDFWADTSDDDGNLG